jgi:hypothetical protein
MVFHAHAHTHKQYFMGRMVLSQIKHVAIYYTDLLGADVCYTTDGSTPVPGKCTVARNVTVYKNTLVKAIAYYRNRSESSASEVRLNLCVCLSVCLSFEAIAYYSNRSESSASKIRLKSVCVCVCV